MRTAAAVLVAFCLCAVVASAQPPDVGSTQDRSFPPLGEWSIGIAFSSLLCGVTGQIWIGDWFGVEACAGGGIVPLQLGIRGLYRPLRGETASLYVGPGIGWREGAIVPHVCAGTGWLVYGPITVHLFGGVGYIGSGTWLPPGPVSTLSSRLYSFFGVSVEYGLGAAAEPSGPGARIPSP